MPIQSHFVLIVFMYPIFQLLLTRLDLLPMMLCLLRASQVSVTYNRLYAADACRYDAIDAFLRQLQLNVFFLQDRGARSRRTTYCLLEHCKRPSASIAWGSHKNIKKQHSKIKYMKINLKNDQETALHCGGHRAKRVHLQ